MPFCHFACGNCMKLPNWLKMIRWGVGAALPVPSIWIPKCNYDAITTQNPKAQYPRVTKKIRLVIFLPVAHESDLCGGNHGKKPWFFDEPVRTLSPSDIPLYHPAKTPRDRRWTWRDHVSKKMPHVSKRWTFWRQTSLCIFICLFRYLLNLS